MGENEKKKLNFQVRKTKTKLTLRAEVAKLVDKIKEYRSEHKESDLAEFQVFNRIFKDLTIMDESLGKHYCTLEGDPNAIERVEVRERIMGIQRVIFCSVISMVEISLKQYAVENPDQIGDTAERVKNSKNVYLSKMLRKCKKEGALSKQGLEEWLLLIDLRNVLVHGGGKADKRIPDGEYYFNGEILEIKQGEMIKGDPAVIAGIIDELLDRLRKIISELQKKKDPNKK